MKKGFNLALSLLMVLSICVPGGLATAYASDGEGTAAGTIASEPVAGSNGTSSVSASASVGGELASGETAGGSEGAGVSASDEGAAGAGDAAGEVASANGANDAEGASDDSASLLRAPQAAPSLQELIDAAPDGGTVTITSDMTIDSTVTIPAGKTVTLTDDGTPRTITGTVEDMFDVQGTLVIAATSDSNLKIVGAGLGMDASPDVSLNKDIASVALVSGTLQLKSGTIVAPNIAGYLEGGIHVVDGTFDMTGGVITGDSSVARGYIYSGTILADGGTVNISGGSITGNAPASSRAVVLSGATLNMTGGSISNNAGGVLATSESAVNFSNGIIDGNNAPGIHCNSGSSLTMTGGTISNNAAKNGGGIRLNDCGAVTISGGTITGNHADSSGGGIYSTAGGELVHITGCTITNNSTDGLGGGIYINSNTAGAQIDNALVTGNSVSIMGGGVWCCPTSEAHIYVSDGMAIFGNTADQAGDDFANLDHSDSQGAVVTIDPNMLGGGDNTFYRDGGILYDKNANVFWNMWTADPNVPRYDAANPGEPVDIDGIQVSRALKNQPTEAAQAVAKIESTVVITGNTAEAGGGIATNGDFTSGYKGWNLTVHKSWADNVPEADRADKVALYLVVDGVPLDYAIVSAETGWQATFNDVPDPDSVNSFEIREGTIAEDGSVSLQDAAANPYIFTMGPVIRDEANATASIEVMNSYPETVNVPVTKVWKGDAAGPVTVHLYADGTDTGKSLTLDADSNWAGSFENVPLTTRTGTAISYTVVEDEVAGYTSEVTGDVASGFTVTNIQVPTENSPHEGTHTPQTGDSLGLLAGAFALVAAGTGAAAIAAHCRKAAKR